jgi:hypothetical protein
MVAKQPTPNYSTNMFSYLNDRVTALNNSKFFAGIMIIILNISSKFVTVKLSKSMESYLKYTFSRNVLVYAIAWMGTRDIFVAFIIMTLFILIMDYLLNEDSALCCLPEQFTDYHLSLLDNNEVVSEEELKKAHETIARAKKQQESKEPQKEKQYDMYSMYK